VLARLLRLLQGGLGIAALDLLLGALRQLDVVILVDDRVGHLDDALVADALRDLLADGEHLGVGHRGGRRRGPAPEPRTPQPASVTSATRTRYRPPTGRTTD
jgi:hypothetical protein